MMKLDRLSQNLPHELNHKIFNAHYPDIPKKFYLVEIDDHRTIQDVLIERGDIPFEMTPYQAFLQILDGKVPKNVCINQLARFFPTTKHLKPLREYLSKIHVSDDELWEFPIFSYLTDLINEWSNVFDPVVDETNINAWLWYNLRLAWNAFDPTCVSQGMFYFIRWRIHTIRYPTHSFVANYGRFIDIVRRGMVRRWYLKYITAKRVFNRWLFQSKRYHRKRYLVIHQLDSMYYAPPMGPFKGGAGYQDSEANFAKMCLVE